MSSNVSTFTKKPLKVTGAVAAATGIVALSALVASGAAVGAVVEGFKTAGETFKDVMKKEETKTGSSETEVQTVEAETRAEGEAQEAEVMEEA